MDGGQRGSGKLGIKFKVTKRQSSSKVGVEEIDLDSSAGGVESTDGKSVHSDALELEPKYFENEVATARAT